MSEEKLVQFLKTGKDWARLRTSVDGVFVLKLPAYRASPPRLAVELNPVDAEDHPKRRRGLLLRSSGDLDDFQGVFQVEKLASLLRSLDAVNPEAVAARRRKGEEVLEL
jgi:hypothetical protein